MPDGSVPLLVALVVLVLTSGFFSAAETAYSCASRIKLRALASNGVKRAAKTLDLAENGFDKLLTTVHIKTQGETAICKTIKQFFVRCFGVRIRSKIFNCKIVYHFDVERFFLFHYQPIPFSIRVILCPYPIYILSD